jgi:hypothetical protein
MLIEIFKYDDSLYDQCFDNQRMSKNHKKIILELVKDKQIDEQTIQDLKKEISHLRVQIEQQFEDIRRRRERDNTESIQSVETRRERERETTFIDSSIVVVSASALSRSSYRSRSINLAESLKENDSKEYNAWTYSVREKLEIDSPMYANDRQRVRYALSQMKNLIFDVMHDWVADVGEALTMESFFKVIENYMGLHHQAKDAKKEFIATTPRVYKTDRIVGA